MVALFCQEKIDFSQKRISTTIWARATVINLELKDKMQQTVCHIK